MARKKHQWTRDEDSPEGEVHYTERATWSSQKKASQKIAELAKDLVKLKAEALDKLPIPEAVRDAIDEAHRLKKKGSVRGGMRRQMLHLASVIRSHDIDEVTILMDCIEDSRRKKRS